MVANCELITRLVILIIFREKIVKLKVFLKKKQKKKQGNQTATTFANVMKILTILIFAVSSLSFIYHS